MSQRTFRGDGGSPGRAAARTWWICAAVYVLLAVLLTWPLALHMGTHVPNDPGDPLLNTFLMSWNARALPLTGGWWTPPQFFPAEGTITFSEHLLGLSVITTPIILATGNALLAYNVVFFLSIAASALACHWLCYSLTRRHDAAVVAALAYSFAPYRLTQLAHVQVLSAYWMPVALAALHHYLESRRLRWAILFAAAWLLQALTCGYYLFFFSVLVALWMAWFRPSPWRAGLPVAAAWIGALTLFAPLAYGYRHYHDLYGLRRGPEEIKAFSADVLGLVTAPHTSALWRWLQVFPRAEAELFPGLMVLLLGAMAVSRTGNGAAPVETPATRGRRALLILAVVCAGVAATPILFGPWSIRAGGARLLSVTDPHKPFTLAVAFTLVLALSSRTMQAKWTARSVPAFYALAAVIMWIFSLGPAPTFRGVPVLYKAPYAWLMQLPGVDEVRVPARFWILATLCLAVCAGFGAARVLARYPARRLLLTCAVGAIICLEGWPHAFKAVPAPLARPSSADAMTRIDLPLSVATDPAALFRAIGHGQRLWNGYSGYFAPHYAALREGIDARDGAVLTLLSEFGAVEVVIDRHTEQSGELRAFVERHPGAQLVSTGDDHWAFRLPASPLRARLGPHAAIRIKTISVSADPAAVGGLTDGDMLTRWRPASGQRTAHQLTLDAGAVHDVEGVVLYLGGYVADFPRDVRISVSQDGQRWDEAWSGTSFVQAIEGALAQPREVPLRYLFASRPARLVRIEQLARDWDYDWSVADVRLLGNSTSR